MHDKIIGKCALCRVEWQFPYKCLLLGTRGSKLPAPSLFLLSKERDRLAYGTTKKPRLIESLPFVSRYTGYCIDGSMFETGLNHRLLLFEHGYGLNPHDEEDNSRHQF